MSDYSADSPKVRARVWSPDSYPLRQESVNEPELEEKIITVRVQEDPITKEEALEKTTNILSRSLTLGKGIPGLRVWSSKF